MPTWDYQCDSCNETMIDVLVGTHQHYPEPTECDKCGSSEIKKLYSFRGFVSQTTFDTDGTRAMHLQHKAWVEDLHRKGELLECKEQGPLEYRPQFDKKFH